MSSRRTVFYLSDRTGITVEMLGRSLISQFEGISWKEENIPFLDSEDKALKAKKKINMAAERDGAKPLIFSTLLDPVIFDRIESSHGILFDFFETFLNPMEQVLKQRSSHEMGKSHSMQSSRSYDSRMSAINFSLNNDDGISTQHYADADIILIGVSRSGKTPTSLYFSMLYGIPAANYPLTDDDMDRDDLPRCLKPFKSKIFGLTITPEQLQRIRQERRPNSRYSSLEQCKKELDWQVQMYERENIPFLDTSSISIEEIATRIIQKAKLKRRLYG